MPYLLEKSSSMIAEVTLGKDVKLGGQTALPYMSYEGANPHRAIVAIEITDREPVEWTDTLKNAWGDVLSDPVAWAKKSSRTRRRNDLS